jgi:hypothetical protein
MVRSDGAGWYGNKRGLMVVKGAVEQILQIIKSKKLELIDYCRVNTMAKIFYCSVIGCFVFVSAYLSFSLSFEAGIVVSALLLEFFSRCFLKNHGGVW